MPRGIYPRTKEMKQRVASIAGSSFHEKRGLQSASKATRKRISSLGGLARLVQIRARKAERESK